MRYTHIPFTVLSSGFMGTSTHPPTHPTLAHSSAFEPPRSPLPSYHPPTHPPTYQTYPCHPPTTSLWVS